MRNKKDKSRADDFCQASLLRSTVSYLLSARETGQGQQRDKSVWAKKNPQDISDAAALGLTTTDREKT